MHSPTQHSNPKRFGRRSSSLVGRDEVSFFRQFWDRSRLTVLRSVLRPRVPKKTALRSPSQLPHRFFNGRNMKNPRGNPWPPSTKFVVLATRATYLSRRSRMTSRTARSRTWNFGGRRGLVEKISQQVQLCPSIHNLRSKSALVTTFVACRRFP